MRTAALMFLYVAAPVLGTYLTFRPTFDSHFALVQTERGDGLLNHYLLENSWLALSDPNYCGSLLSPPLYFPTKLTIYYSENLFGVAPLYWVLRLVLPHDLAYAWWQILLNLLNFVAFALAARWLKMPHLIALGGAFMWGFALVHADQIKHQQLIGRFWMPLAVYYAIGLVTEPAAKPLNRLLGCIFFQSLACIYTGWFLVAGLAVFVPLLAALRPGAAGALKLFARENRRELIRTFGLWGAALAALFGPYMAVNFGIGRGYEETYKLMPTPSAWITGPPDSMWVITTEPYRVTVHLECWLFSGFTIYALMIASVVGLFFYSRDARPVGWAVIAAAMGTAALWVLLTLTPAERGDSLWRWARYLPGGMAIRCVSRVYLVVYLFGSIAGLTWLTRVTERVRNEWLRYAVQGLVVGAMVCEQTQYQQPSFARTNFYPLVDAAARDLRGATVAYVVPRYVDATGVVADGVPGEVFGMWVGLRANVSVVNGYSGRAPDGFPPFGPLSDEDVRGWLKGKFRGTVRIVDSETPGRFRELAVE
ncbi:hypothetical protein [Frigoriglobus tundricola]|uniref:Glycosyltransferase RgtA/B/C/D-like domain-containing protein n=1 Tax=Frigoriglobus tundricola TaxID=2774151 RepID=A0A6M5YXG6_9BACT|nr:hypothetical protein [Frigoriglobus tundricola]QJW98164.1 hypothetical protein FTUN_5744 [Frigoriglobus tundricola]